MKKQFLSLNKNQQFENLLIVYIYLLSHSRCLWQNVSVMSTQREKLLQKECDQVLDALDLVWMVSFWYTVLTSQCLCRIVISYQPLFCHLIEYSVTYSLTCYLCNVFLTCRKKLNVSLTQYNDGEVQKEQQ